jgi:type VI secretion system secreted protein Hcp
MPIYMKIEGIDGNVTAAGHEKWIEVSSMNFGCGRSIMSREPGHESNREASAPSISAVTVSKEMDETTPLLFTQATIGDAKKVEIHLCRTGEQLQSFMEYTLSNTLISSYSVSAAGSMHPSESLTLNFDKIEMKYNSFDDKHKKKTSVPAGYDMSTAKKV